MRKLTFLASTVLLVLFGLSKMAWAQCGAITFIGCCVDDNTAKYCSKGVLKTNDCTANPKCGWDAAKKYYTCGTTGGSDPSGTNPRLCSALPDAGPAGDKGPTGDKGPLPDKGPPREAAPFVPCGTVPGKGCCEGETLKYCTKATGLVTKDCTSQPKCGWDTAKSFYSCGTSGTADPSGVNVMDCAKQPPKTDGGGTIRDGAKPPTDRGGSTADQPGMFDSYTPPQVDKGGTTKKSGDSGCSCSLEASAAPSSLVLMLLLGMAALGLVVRRRS